MSEHLIHLRRAWEGTFLEGGIEGVRRVDLPAFWPLESDVPIRLTRSFRRPPIEPNRERLLIRLSTVPGLISVKCNGQELARPVIGSADLELAIEVPTPARNLLTLELDPAGAVDAGNLWGTVALVIRSG